MKSLLFLLLAFVASTTSKRIKGRIYTDLQETAFCFRRTNGTHQFGCTSDQNGNVGVVHLISQDSEVNWLVEKGPHSPYVAVITPKMFKKDTLATLKNSGKINGIILLGVNESLSLLEKPQKYSSDSTCPNKPSSLYSEARNWNPEGSNVLFEDWPFPIFLVKDTEKVENLVFDCYEKFNKPKNDVARNWPLCAVELKSHMSAAVDTKTCQRRNNLINPFSPVLVCDPMGDQNVFHLDGQNVDWSQERFQDKSILIVSTQLDGINNFDKQEFGFDSPSTGIVTLLAVAEILYRKEFSPQNGKNVLFAFLNGESFDYIGSSKMVYDMKNGKFPFDKSEVEDEENGLEWPLIDLKSILGQIELGPLSNAKANNLFAHVDSQFNSDLLEKLKAKATQSNLNIQSASGSTLPPASVQSLLKEDRKIPAIFLSNFNSEFTNPYFHSLYDDVRPPQIVSHLAKISETLARFISEVVGTNLNDFKADETLIENLLKCYTESSQCDMFYAVTSTDFVSKTRLIDQPLPQYVGVDRSHTYHTLFTHRLLAYLTTKPLPGQYSVSNCTKSKTTEAYNPYFVNGEEIPSYWNGTKDECDQSPDCGFCLNTTAFLTKAVSPGKPFLSIFKHSEYMQNAVKMQSKCSRNAVEMQAKCSQNAVKMQAKCSQNATKMH